jgi:hypothetical protein
MSDGPHRGLQMRRGWKRVAEFAYNPVYAPEEVCNKIISALHQDWRADIPRTLLSGVRDVLGEEQGFLFKDQKIAQLESLGRLAAGHGLGRTLIDCAIKALTDIGAGPDALLDAVKNTLLDRALRGARQVEEHYCRRSLTPRAQNVRLRIDDGIKNAAIDTLAHQILHRDSIPVWSPPAKQQGLDDGVRF